MIATVRSFSGESFKSMWNAMLESPPSSRPTTSHQTAAKKTRTLNRSSSRPGSRPRRGSRDAGQGSRSRRGSRRGSRQATSPTARKTAAAGVLSRMPAQLAKPASMTDVSDDEAELRTMTASLGNRVGLQELDLAWNSIRGAGAVKLFTAMAKDCKLKVSNASLMFRVTARLTSALFSN